MREIREWEAERKKIMERVNAEKVEKKEVVEEEAASYRKKAAEEMGEELMGDADAMWAEVATKKKKKKPRHQ